MLCEFHAQLKHFAPDYTLKILAALLKLAGLQMSTSLEYCAPIMSQYITLNVRMNSKMIIMEKN